jgi:sigma-B regulation protein RsbU (phosphoserine phosphatase)
MMNKALRALAVLTALPWCGLLAQEIPEWRVQRGDNLAWAAPDFDDSTWQTGSWPSIGARTDDPIPHWYRARITLDPKLVGEEAAIALPPLFEIYEVYVDGKLVGSHGAWGDRQHAPFPAARVFRIPSTKTMTIAIRRWFGESPKNYAINQTSEFYLHSHPPMIGKASVLELVEENHSAKLLIASSPRLLVLVLLASAGLLSGAIYFSQQSRMDNLWLGILLLSYSVPPILNLGLQFSDAPLRSEWSTILLIWNFGWMVAEVIWFRSICPRFQSFFWWAAVVQTLFVLSRAVSYYFQIPVFDGSLQVVPLFRMTLVLVATVGLLREGRSQHSVVLISASFVSAIFQYLVANSGSWGVNLQAGGLYLDIRIAAMLIFAALALLGLYLKHLKEAKDKEILDQDLMAASLVQDSLLVAEGSAEWAVDAVYLPAKEVGGDFYHTTLAKDGSLLVVTGDVSGKGLPASLLVAAVVGALGDLSSREPAEVLAHLNRSLLGKTRGGFVTCVCALFRGDGPVTIANAGHLPPWVDGRELEIEAGLPLGVVDGVAYEEKQARGERFVFVSDGVVEAANAKGELLGFERSRGLSAKAARELAESARAWGQNDDITVVTVRRAKC